MTNTMYIIFIPKHSVWVRSTIARGEDGPGRPIQSATGDLPILVENECDS